MATEMRQLSPEQDAVDHIIARRDKSVLEERFDIFKGRGVFSRETIEPSTFVVEYRGDIISHRESQRKKHDDPQNNYLFDFSWNGRCWCIDATKEDGSLGRLVNDGHRNANCKMRTITFEGMPHLCLFAMKEISPGEEITYNHGDASCPWRSGPEDLTASSSEDDEDCAPDSAPSNDSDDCSTAINEQKAPHLQKPPPVKQESDSSEERTMDVPQPKDFSCFQQEDKAAFTSDKSGSTDHVPNEDSPCSKKNYCYVCGIGQSKIARHLEKHKDEQSAIAKAFAFPKHSQERKRLLERLRNKGNYQHNREVLQNRSGQLKLKRRPSKTNLPLTQRKYVHCPYCKAMYFSKELWRHMSRCSSKTVSDTEEETGRTKVSALVAMAQSIVCQQSSSGLQKMLGHMKQDEIASVVKSDFLILQLAQSLYNKHGQDPTKSLYIRNKLREMGRLLLILRKISKNQIFSFEDAVKPNNFNKVIEAVKELAGFNEEMHSYHSPSLARKLGNSLRKIGTIVLTRALTADDDAQVIKEAERFTRLCSNEELLSPTALAASTKAKLNESSTLPFTRDVQLLHQYLERKSADAIKSLTDHESPQTYSELARVILAQVVISNKWCAAKLSKMTLKSFQQRDQTEHREDIAVGLSQFQQKLSKHFIRVEIKANHDRKCAALLNPELVSAITLLVNKRDACGVHRDNPFLFARANYHCSSFDSPQDYIRSFASQCGAHNPESFRDARLRKHVAILSQILSLNDNELEQLANFLGCNIRIHRDFYRLPEATIDIAKISKLLLSMEKGSLARFQGKSLEEIEIEDELEPDLEGDDAENNDDDEEDYEVSDPSRRPGKRKRMKMTQDEATSSKDPAPLEDSVSAVETVSTVSSLTGSELHSTVECERECMANELKAEKAGEKVNSLEDLKIGSVLSEKGNSASPVTETQSSPALLSPTMHMVCSHCKKNLMMGQKAYQGKGSPDIFCSTSCILATLTHLKPVTNNCHHCYKVITQLQDLILAPVDAKGTMKDFCSKACLSSFISMCTRHCNKTKTPQPHSQTSDVVDEKTSEDTVDLSCTSSCLMACKVQPISASVSVAEGKSSLVTTHTEEKPSALPQPTEEDQSKDDMVPSSSPSCEATASSGSGDSTSSAVVNGMKVVEESVPKLDNEQLQGSTQTSQKSSTCNPLTLPLSPPLVKVNDQPMDEERNQTSSASTVGTGDEPDTAKKECSLCMATLMDDQIVYQRNGCPDIFCSASCFSATLPHYQPVAKNCFRCQRAIMRPQDVILAPVDAKGTMKELCSQTCLSSVNRHLSTKIYKEPKPSQSLCHMCKKYSNSKYEGILNGAVHKICSDACLTHFRSVNNMTVALCWNCGAHSHNKPLKLKMEDGSKTLCGAECLAKFKEKIKIPQPCTMCRTSLPMADMVDDKSEDTVHLFCTSSCLMAYKTQTDSASVSVKEDRNSPVAEDTDEKPSVSPQPMEEDQSEDKKVPVNLLQPSSSPSCEATASTGLDSTSSAEVNKMKRARVLIRRLDIGRLQASTQTPSTCNTVKPPLSPPLVKVKDETMDEEYNQALTFSTSTADVKEETDTEKEDLKIVEVFSMTGNSASPATETQSTPTLVPLHATCSHCKKKLIDMQTVYQRKSYPELFCTRACLFATLPHIKQVTKSCHYCFQVITQPQDAVLAPVDAGLKDFCSQTCLSSFNYKWNMSTKIPLQQIASQSVCSMCIRYCISKHEVILNGAVLKFCSDACFVRFRTVNNNMTMGICANCGSHCHNKPLILKMEDGSKTLCGAECLAKFKQEKFKKAPETSVQIQTSTCNPSQPDVTKDPVKLPCFYCYSLITTKPVFIQIKDKMVFVCSSDCSQEFKKDNFMTSLCKYCKMEKVPKHVKRINNKDCHFCSDDCQLLYKLALAKNWGKLCGCCAYCLSISKVMVTGQYRGTIKEFCSDDCKFNYTMLFCNFAKCDTCGHKGELMQSLPLLGEVKHFCDLNCLLHFCRINTFTVGHVVTKDAVPDVETEIVGHTSTQTLAVQALKNKAVLCRPNVRNKGVGCEIQTVHAETQTDDAFPKVIVLPVPVPVPVFIPLPMSMYSQYTPRPVGLPLPLPVPMFLPVTLDSAERIVETIQEIKEKIPSDPFEAELLLMAEMVAEQVENDEKKEGLKEKDRERPDAHAPDETLEMIAQLREEAQRSPSPLAASPRRLQGHRKARDKKKGNKSQRVAEAAAVRGCSKKAKSKDPPKLKIQYGIDAWKRWVQWRKTQPNMETPRFGLHPMELKENILRCTATELRYGLCCFISEVKRPNGEPYSPDSLFYLCLGIQQELFFNGHVENIFNDQFYCKFSMEFTKRLKDVQPSVTASGYVHSRVEEEYLWDCKQLGAYSPIVLLNTLLFFCCKYFGFSTVEEHRRLSFAHVRRCTKTSPNNTKTTFLRFYPPITTNESETQPQTDIDGVPAKKRKEEDSKEDILEMMENSENPLRCPVRLYEFYLSKCPESVKESTNLFYLHLARCCAPNSPMWFSSTPLDNSTMEAMLIRILTVRELHLRPGKRRRQRTPDDPPFIADEEEEDSE